MKTVYRTNIIIDFTGLAIILLSILMKYVYTSSGAANRSLHTVYTLLYFLFFVLWMITLDRRIIHQNARKILLMIATSEILWLLIRTVKYEFVPGNSTLDRYCWYLYYLPLLMLPALCFLLALSMRKPESWRLSKKLMLFPVISIVLFLLVLTNDLHKTVFIIPSGPDGNDVGNYHYGPSYYLLVAYILACVLACYGIILVKCRIKNRRMLHFLPILPLVFGTAVLIWYYSGNVVLLKAYHLDITVFICYLTTVTLEMCIQSGLIMSNIGYTELFQQSSVQVLITDEQFSTLLSSDRDAFLTPEEIRAAQTQPLLRKDGMRLSSAPIKGGHVLWLEDLSELLKTLRELSEKQDYLLGKNDIIRQANSYRKKERRLIEQNGLYNRILTQTKKEIELYAALVEELGSETDPERSRMLVQKLAFVGAFIKRHDNLIFLNEMDNAIAPSELSYCIEESLSTLRLCGIRCFCSYCLSQPLPFEKISGMYKTFYLLLLDLLHSLKSVCVYLVEEGTEAVILIRLLCDPKQDLLQNIPEHTRIEKEDEEWVVTIN